VNCAANPVIRDVNFPVCNSAIEGDLKATMLRMLDGREFFQL
jgi:hypothetical protein